MRSRFTVVFLAAGVPDKISQLRLETIQPFDPLEGLIEPEKCNDDIRLQPGKPLIRLLVKTATCMT